MFFLILKHDPNTLQGGKKGFHVDSSNGYTLYRVLHSGVKVYSAYVLQCVDYIMTSFQYFPNEAKIISTQNVKSSTTYEVSHMVLKSIPFSFVPMILYFRLRSEDKTLYPESIWNPLQPLQKRLDLFVLIILKTFKVLYGQTWFHVNSLKAMWLTIWIYIKVSFQRDCSIWITR